MKTIRIRAGRERSLLKRHPWVFDGSIESGKADAGETVRVEASDGRFLAWAAYSPRSQIRLRVWSFDAEERIDTAFFARRVDAAVSFRERLAVDSDGVRLVHAESDGLPGVIADRFGDVLSVQFSFAGSERWKGAIVDALVARTGCGSVYERSDVAAREREGLAPASGWLRGGRASAEAAIGDRTTDERGVDGPVTGRERVTIREHGWSFAVDIAGGQKTGFYLDQRDNRRLFADAVSRFGVRTVLDAYSYTGGFSVAAYAGGAEHVTAIDSSAPALERARENVAANAVATAPSRAFESIDADVNRTLRAFVDAGRRFDAIVLDPPKLAPTAAHADRAARAYKDINRLAFSLLAPGGLLFTFSCSGGIGADLFHKIVAGAGIDAGIDGRVIARMSAAADHPMTVTFPEGEYLKGLAIVAVKS